MQIPLNFSGLYTAISLLAAHLREFFNNESPRFIKSGQNESLTWPISIDWSSTTGTKECENTTHKIGNEATEKRPCR